MEKPLELRGFLDSNGKLANTLNFIAVNELDLPQYKRWKGDRGKQALNGTENYLGIPLIRRSLVYSDLQICLLWSLETGLHLFHTSSKLTL